MVMDTSLILAVLLFGADSSTAQRGSSTFNAAVSSGSTESGFLQCINHEMDKIKDKQYCSQSEQQITTLTGNFQSVVRDLFKERGKRLTDLLKNSNQEVVQLIQNLPKGEDCKSCLAEIVPLIEGLAKDVGELKILVGKNYDALVAAAAKQAAFYKESSSSFESYKKSVKLTMAKEFKRVRCAAPIIKTSNRQGSKEWTITSKPLEIRRGSRKHHRKHFVLEEDD